LNVLLLQYVEVYVKDCWIVDYWNFITGLDYFQQQRQHNDEPSLGMHEEIHNAAVHCCSYPTPQRPLKLRSEQGLRASACYINVDIVSHFVDMYLYLEILKQSKQKSLHVEKQRYFQPLIKFGTFSNPAFTTKCCFQIDWHSCSWKSVWP